MELSKATKALIIHPASHFPAKGHILPCLEFDPNPEVMLALHGLWATIRPFLIISPTDGSIGTRCRTSELAEVLLSFWPTLVSLSFCFFLLSKLITSNTGLLSPGTATQQSRVARRLQCLTLDPVTAICGWWSCLPVSCHSARGIPSWHPSGLHYHCKSFYSLLQWWLMPLSLATPHLLQLRTFGRRPALHSWSSRIHSGSSLRQSG